MTVGGDVVDESVGDGKIKREIRADHGRERQVRRADVGDGRLVLPVRSLVRAVEDVPVGSGWNGYNDF